MKIISWNIVTIRKFKHFNYFTSEYDVIAIQEIKYNNIQDLHNNYNLDGYFDYWSVSNKPGYSGCGLYVRHKPDDYKIDTDGRYIILFYEHFLLVNTYVMNAGDKLKNLNIRLEWDIKFRNLLYELINKTNKHLILIGDMNCAHKPIDVKNPSSKLKSPGFSIEERESFDILLDKLNLIDTYRYLHPKQIKYTYFSYRGNTRKNHNGWRLDYVLISKSLLPKLLQSDIHEDVLGSDHVPITTELNLEL